MFVFISSIDIFSCQHHHEQLFVSDDPINTDRGITPSVDNKLCTALKSCDLDTKLSQESDSQPTYKVSSSSLTRNATYNVISPSIDGNVGTDFSVNNDPTIEDGADSKVNDADSVKPIVSNPIPDNDAVVAKSPSSNAITKIKEADDRELSLNTQQTFVTVTEMPETSPAAASSRSESCSTVISTSQSSRPVVQLSKCKSPGMQRHMARMMGCKPSLIPVRTGRSSRIQVVPKVAEASTQCFVSKLNDSSMQTPATNVVASSMQTSPSLFKC